MKNDSLKTYCQYLKTKGYVANQSLLKDWYGDDVTPADLDKYPFIHTTNKCEVVLGICSDNTETTVLNVNDYTVTSAEFYKHDEPDTAWISLSSEAEDGVEFYPHSYQSMTLFKKVLDIQNDPLTHNIYILNCHVQNLKTIQKKFVPILAKYDFYLQITLNECIFGITDLGDTDALTVGYNHIDNNCDAYGYFSTHPLTGKLIINRGETDGDNFEEYILKKHIQDYEGKPQLKYRYLFDKTYTSETYYTLTSLMNIINRNSTPLQKAHSIAKNIDFKHLQSPDLLSWVIRAREILQEGYNSIVTQMDGYHYR